MGNIGVGKTSIGQLLSKSTFNKSKSQFIEEAFKTNPFLGSFYSEMNIVGPTGYNKFALRTQLNFLEQRFNREKEECVCPETMYLIDRCMLEDNLIFAKNSVNSGVMNNNEYLEYLEVYNGYIR